MFNQNIYINLLAQFDKIFRYNRQGSFKTRQRYGEAFKRFLYFLAVEYRVERVANIGPKHIRAYADRLAEQGKSVAYLKTELSAIRFFHDQIPKARHTVLPSNKDLGIAKRQFGGVDHTWSNREYDRFVVKAEEQGREDYVTVLCLARYAALRLHECFRLDTQTAAKAVKSGTLTIKGKGGLVRDVPINTSILIQLNKMLAVTQRGHKLFVKSEDKTHFAMQRFEGFNL